MAIYHLSAKIISAAEGQSAVAAAAYRHSARIEREADGRVHDYTAKTDVTHSEITLPADAPAWAAERYPSAAEGSGRLWNDIEARESEHCRRATAQLAREIEFSLPIELTSDEQVALARDFIAGSLAGRGFSCDWAVHQVEGNPHVHAMFTERAPTGEAGRWGNKIRGPSGRQELLELRAEWAMAANRHLERCGHDVRIDHRSHADRGLTIEPGVHRGSEPTVPELHKAWQARVEEDAAIRAENEQWLREHPEELVKLAAARQETITRPILLEEALGRLQFGAMAEAEAYVDLAVQSGALVPAVASEADAGDAWNAVTHVQHVHALSRAAETLAGERFTAAEGTDPAEALAHSDLDDGQRLAAEAVLDPDSRLALVTGLAGAGKTHMLGAAAEVLQAAGVEVLGAAPSGRAAAELDSPHIRTRTVADWLQQTMAWTAEGQPFVFVLDEAGMVGTRDAAAIAHEVEQRGGKLVMIGDAEQLQPIAAGKPFRILSDRFGSAETAWAMRQQDTADRRATIALARGKSAAALEHYERKGAIVFHDAVGSAVAGIAAEYWQQEGRVVALAHRNVDVDATNHAVRAAGVAAGRVSGFRQFATRNGNVQFGTGDRVIATRTLSGNKVLKGTFGIVREGPSGDLEVMFDERASAVPLVARTANHLALGYGVTIHKSQGMTVDHALVLAGGTLDKHLGYVALSRHRDRLTIHVDGSSVADTSELAARLRRTDRSQPRSPAERAHPDRRQVDGAMEPEQRPSADPRALEIMEMAAGWCQHQLQGERGAAARAYLESRGLGPEAQSSFRIGYAPAGRSGLIAAMAEQGVGADELEAVGLLGRRDGTGQRHDRFRDRIMFPIADAAGRCIAFGGRAMDPGAPAKHLNSPDTALFDKGRTVYGLAAAAEDAAMAGVMHVVEGCMDVIAMAEAGIPNVVASLGTAVTAEQLEQMWQAAPHLVIVPDGDEAGRRAASRVPDTALPLLHGERSLAIAALPEGEDPVSMIRSGDDVRLAECLDDAVPLVAALWNSSVEGRVIDSPDRRAALDRTLEEALEKIPDAALREQHRADLADFQVEAFGYSNLAPAIPADDGADGRLADGAAPVIDLSDLGAGGPGLAPNDGHVESLIVHYSSNLLAAAASEGMVRTDTGRAMADDPGLLARHMAARHSAWTVDDAARHLARHVDDPVTFRRVLTEALSDPDVMTVLPESYEHPERLLSTWSRIQLEADLMADAEILAGRDMALPGAPATAAERLTPEQRETLEELLAGPALQIVDGDAGAGKSAVAAALHDAAARAGVPASMVVPTGNDAALARAMVANPASVQTARQPLPVGEEPRLFILDSAESFSPEETAQVLRTALRTGSKVVMAGDQRSLEPMAGASPYAALCERLGVRSLSGSLRARSPAERDFVRHMSRGTPDGDRAAVDYLAAHGRLAGAADTGGAIENAVTAYLADRTPDKVMIAHTRAQVRALNAGLMARLEGREGQVVRTLGGGPIDLAVGDVVVVQRGEPGSVVPERRRAAVTSLSPAGRVGLDFGEHDEGGRMAVADASTVRLEHGWAQTIRSAREPAASVHFLATASNNRQTVCAGCTRHREQVHVYVADRDAASTLGRLLATSGRQRWALDYGSALAPDGQRLLAEYLEDGGGAAEAWLDTIHRTGREPAMDRAMVVVGDALVGRGHRWWERLMRYTALGNVGTAQHVLQGRLFDGARADPVLASLGSEIARRPGVPAASRTAGRDMFLKNAAMVLSVAAGESLRDGQALAPRDIRRTLAAGEGGNWLVRRLIERRAEAVAREIARARNERLARRGVLDDLGVPAAVLDEPVGWTMVEPELREEYDQRAPKAVARARRAPTELDRAVARAEVVAEDSGDAEAMRQVAALREALARAPVRTPSAIAADRRAIIKDLDSGKALSADALFHRLHRAFSAPEIDALMSGAKPGAEEARLLDPAGRKRISDHLMMHAARLSPELSAPWAGRVRSLSMARGRSL